MAPFLSWLCRESGFSSLRHSARDSQLLCLQRFVRLFGFGGSSLILVLFLQELHISHNQIGVFQTLTLLGDVAISLLLTVFADALGRRNMLILGAMMMTISGIVCAFSSNFWVLLAACTVGVLSPSGDEVGPFRAVEESTLAQLSTKEVRSDIFAWYTITGAMGASLGQIVTGWTTETLAAKMGWSTLRAFRITFVIYAGVGLVKLLLCLLLSSGMEQAARPQLKTPSQHNTDASDVDAPLLQQEAALTVSDGRLSPGLVERASTGGANPNHSSATEASSAPPLRAAVASLSASISAPSSVSSSDKLQGLCVPRISRQSKITTAKICALFAMDSLGSGLVTISWLALYFTSIHRLPSGPLGTLFSITSLATAVSNLVSASVARRVSLIKAMVFTHLPSSLFLALIPAAPATRRGKWGAMIFLTLRACTSHMDVAPRQAFVAQAVWSGERTAVMGLVNVVRTVGLSIGPSLTGLLVEHGLFWVAFVAAGVLKVSYDLGCLVLFARFQSPEEEPMMY